MTRTEIDEVFLQWAKHRGLRVSSIEQWDDTSNRALVADSAGDVYVLYAGPDPKDPKYPASQNVLVGASLVKRGDRKHHALKRERMRFSFSEIVPPAQAEVAFEAALHRVQLWIAEAGHELRLENEDA